MMERLDLSYFYGQESDQFNFVKIPKPLLYDPMYKEVRLEEAMVYSMLLDRMRLLMKNGWFDELGRAYIYCSIDTVMELADCGKNKACDMLKKLDAIGLIDKVLIPGRGLKIYVKNFIPKDAATKFENRTDSEDITVEKFSKDNFNEDFKQFDDMKASRISNQEVYNSNHAVCNSNSQIPENKPEAVCFSNINKTNINNTKYSENKSNHIESESERQDRDEIGYARLLRENIELDALMERHPENHDLLQGIYDILLETVLSKKDSMVIASDTYSTNLVKGKLLHLNSEHIEYVMDSLEKCTNKPRNIKKYLLAALFNAPSTIDAYYQTEYSYHVGNSDFTKAQ